MFSPLLEKQPVQKWISKSVPRFLQASSPLLYYFLQNPHKLLPFLFIYILRQVSLYGLASHYQALPFFRPMRSRLQVRRSFCRSTIRSPPIRKLLQEGPPWLLRCDIGREDLDGCSPERVVALWSEKDLRAASETHFKS